MRAIRFETTGGPEVLQTVEIETPTPGPGQILIRHQAIGVNFIETYQRSGLYPVKLPAIPGGEAAGVVEAVGEGVSRFKVGDRVATTNAGGAYAEASLAPANRAVAIPDGISTEVAAAILLKGMTTEAFVRRTYPVKAGETVLVHAAVGGVGQIMTQWLKAIGADSDRDRGVGGQGDKGPGPWGRPRDPLPRTGRRRGSPPDHRGRGRSRGL